MMDIEVFAYLEREKYIVTLTIVYRISSRILMILRDKKIKIEW